MLVELSTYELLDLVSSWKSDTAEGLTSLMSILSAYLLVAYLVGSKLTRSQVLIVTTLMLWFSGISIFQIFTNLQMLIELNEQDVLHHGGPERALRWAIGSRWIVVSGCLFALIGSVKFMWDVRRTEAG